MKGNLTLSRQNFIRLATGGGAILLATLFLVRQWSDPRTVVACLFFITIATTDTLQDKILNSTNLLMCVAGFTLQGVNDGLHGLFIAGLGLLAGFFLLLIPYMLRGVGGGDIKALAALGTLGGPMAIWQIFIYICLLGGIIAILHYVCALTAKELRGVGTGWMATLLMATPSGEKRPWEFMPRLPRERARYPYAASIALGFFAYAKWGGIV